MDIDHERLNSLLDDYLRSRKSSAKRLLMEALLEPTRRLVEIRLRGHMPNTRPNADDILQDVLVKIILGLDHYERDNEGPGRIWGWVSTIARNHVLDRQRQYRRGQGKLGLQKPLDEVATQSDQTSDKNEEIHNALYALISELPEQERTIIELRFFEGLKFSEIAQRDGSLGSVSTIHGKLKSTLLSLHNKLRDLQE